MCRDRKAIHSIKVSSCFGISFINSRVPPPPFLSAGLPLGDQDVFLSRSGDLSVILIPHCENTQQLSDEPKAGNSPPDVHVNGCRPFNKCDIFLCRRREAKPLRLKRNWTDCIWFPVSENITGTRIQRSPFNISPYEFCLLILSNISDFFFFLWMCVSLKEISMFNNLWYKKIHMSSLNHEMMPHKQEVVISGNLFYSPLSRDFDH